MGVTSREDVDDLLERYLEGLVPMDAVTKSDCKETHEKLDERVMTAIKESAGKTSTSIKLWAVGSAFAAFIAVLGGYTCAMTEVGAYKERIDNSTRQNEELKQDLKEMRTEIRGIRDLLLQKEGP